MSKTISSKEWFAVDKKGLANILRRRGIEFAVFELIQNSWDEDGVTRVDVGLRLHDDRGYAVLQISDDAPDGFKDIRHAFTLFADSSKKKDATKRGRFNLGEKLVLALCRTASIKTTTGSVLFSDNGRQVNSRQARTHGSELCCTLRMNRDEVARVGEAVKQLIPPRGINTFYNGDLLMEPLIETELTVTLPTEIGDSDGALRRTARPTLVRLYRPATGEPARIYEMGIPVVEHDCAYHCDVHQKVPLTIDRENVAPAFVKALRTAVFNNTHSFLTTEDMTREWVQTAMESSEITDAAVFDFALKRFGEKRVSFDPSDPEANKLAVADGFTVVHGGMLSGDAWSNLRRVEAIKPAGQVTPSAKAWTGEGDPDAKQAEPIPLHKWTSEMVDIVHYARKIATETLGVTIHVKYFNTAHMLCGAAYGGRCLSFNKFRLGNAWFDMKTNRVSIDNLIIHELGHELCSDHLSEDYHDALTLIAARFIDCVRKGKL